MVQGPPMGPPGPPSRPRGGPPDSFRSERCAQCLGALYRTKATGQPWQEDHEQGCEFFSRALQVMRYVKELKRAASEPESQSASRGERRYLQKRVKEISAAACADNPILAISVLAHKYAAECETNTKRAKTADMLMQACQALVQGKDPAPITEPFSS
jgi:hypothetical protein